MMPSPVAPSFFRLFFKPVLFVLAVAVVTTAAPPARAEPAQVGEVHRARGEALIRRAILERPASAGSPVLFQDVLETGAETRLHVAFKDGSRLMMGDTSRLTVDELVYDPGQSGRGALMLSYGVFRLVSGQVNKVPGGTLTVVTPLAHIGVRGTDFWGQQTEDRLFMALLEDGELTITTDHGAVTLNRPGTAVEILPGQAPGDVFELSEEQMRAAVATVAW